MQGNESKCDLDILFFLVLLNKHFTSRKNNKESVLTEAMERLDKVISVNFASIAKELVGHEIFQYMRAISPALQEFIEALTFYEFLSDKQCSDWENIQERFKYKDDASEEISLYLSPAEYMLGYADNTGEIMRYCINSLGSGETDNCFKACKFLQNVYANFLSIGSVPNHGRDFSQKISTMKMSTLKTEHVCYQLKVRGTEGAKFPSLDIKLDEDIDEGFY